MIKERRSAKVVSPNDLVFLHSKYIMFSKLKINLKEKKIVQREEAGKRREKRGPL